MQLSFPASKACQFRPACGKTYAQAGARTCLCPGAGKLFFNKSGIVFIKI